MSLGDDDLTPLPQELPRAGEREKRDTLEVELLRTQVHHLGTEMANLRAEVDRLRSIMAAGADEVNRLRDELRGPGGIGEMARNALVIAKHLRKKETP